MNSFAKILDQMEAEQEVVALESYDSRATAAIRAGQNINPHFWQDFMKVCNQADALAELLNVRKEIIASWPSRVQQKLQEVIHLDGNASTKTTLMKTGY